MCTFAALPISKLVVGEVFVQLFLGFYLILENLTHTIFQKSLKSKFNSSNVCSINGA